LVSPDGRGEEEEEERGVREEENEQFLNFFLQSFPTVKKMS
jgi:hypothetical protein